MIHVSDDGTMDTVFQCDECGAELRYSGDAFERDEDGTFLDPEGVQETVSSDHADECELYQGEDEIDAD